MALTSWVEAFDLAQWPRIVHDVLRPADSYARSRFIEMIESRRPILPVPIPPAVAEIGDATPVEYEPTSGAARASAQCPDAFLP